MRLKIDLTLEQRLDFSNFFQKRGLGLLSPSSLLTSCSLMSKVSSVEFIQGNYDNVLWRGLFIIHFGRAYELEPVKFGLISNSTPDASSNYSGLMEWFKPKVRDWKLEELGI
jgi:hypothetical protein